MDNKIFEKAIRERLELHYPDAKVEDLKITNIICLHPEGKAQYQVQYTCLFDKVFSERDTVVSDLEICEGPVRWITKEVGSIEQS